MGRTVTRGMKKIVSVILLVIIAFGAGVLGSKFLFNNDDVSSTEIKRSLKYDDDLITVIITEKGKKKYDDDGISIINKADFTAKFKAYIGIGIDLKKVKVTKIDNTNKKIYVTMPKSKVKYVVVDPDSLKLYDKKFAVFNFDEKEDAIKLASQIQEEVKNRLKDSEYDKADAHAEVLVRGMITAAAPRHEVVFE